MSKSVVIFVPANPYPPKYGFLMRAFSMIKGFHELGFDTHLFSMENTSGPNWTEESIEYLEQNWVKKVHIYKNSKLDDRYRKLLKRVYSKFLHKKPPVLSSYNTPPGMRAWFTREVKVISPILIMINYAGFDGILDHHQFRSTIRVLDTTDLQTCNLAMQKYLRQYLPSSPIDPVKVNPDITIESFFSKPFLKADQKEFRICDRYTKTIAISLREAEIITNNTSRTDVLFIPMMQEIADISNAYSGSALFPVGPNPFNIQGYVYFVQRVLPKVIEICPDFELQISGKFFNNSTVLVVPGIKLLGFVPELTTYYENCRFVISPVFGGTGQQVKIVEAMAHGLPVVALQDAADRSPMIDEVNGLVAKNADEFAKHVCRLWKDRDLCRKLGGAARETIRENFSQEVLRLEILKLFE